MEIRIGTRPSPLAVIQAEEAMLSLKKMHPGTSFIICPISTSGDIDKATPISEVEGSDFFTKEIDEALLAGEIDLAVHSSKDMPDKIPNGLVVVFETEPISRNDALVSRNNVKLADIPAGWRIGTSSSRRKEQIKALRRDIQIIDIRGTIGERLLLIDEGKIDSLIVAHAALIRLGLEGLATEILPLDLFETHPKQGSLSLVARIKR